MPGQMMSADNYICGLHVGSTIKKGNQIHLICSQEDESLFCLASGYVITKHQLAIKATENVKAKLTFQREDQSQGVAIQVYHTDIGIFNASEFIEELLKNHKKIRFSGAGASHQNGTSERAINKVGTMERTTLIHAALRCPWDTFLLIFGRWQYNMLYGYTIVSLICSLDYLLFKYGQGWGLRQCQKPLATIMFGVVQQMFKNQNCRILQ